MKLKYLTPVIASALALTAASQASAQDRSMFKEIMMQGIEYYTHGEEDPSLYNKAIEKFTLARRYSDDPQPIYNIARTYQRLHNCEQALHAYREYDYMAQQTPKYGVTDVSDFIADLEAQCGNGMGQLATSCNPVDTMVVIDHKKPVKCSEVHNLKNGQHTVEFRLSGYETVTRSISIKTGERQVISASMKGRTSSIQSGTSRKMNALDYYGSENMLYVEVPQDTRHEAEQITSEYLVSNREDINPALLKAPKMSNRKMLWTGLGFSIAGLGLGVGGTFLTVSAFHEDVHFGAKEGTLSVSDSENSYKGGIAMLAIGSAVAVTGLALMIADIVKNDELEEKRANRLSKSISVAPTVTLTGDYSGAGMIMQF